MLNFYGVAELVRAGNQRLLVAGIPRRGNHGIEAVISRKEVVRDLNPHVEVLGCTGGERETFRDGAVPGDRGRSATVWRPFGGAAVVGAWTHARSQNHRIVAEARHVRGDRRESLRGPGRLRRPIPRARVLHGHVILQHIPGPDRTASLPRDLGPPRIRDFQIRVFRLDTVTELVRVHDPRFTIPRVPGCGEHTLQTLVSRKEVAGDLDPQVEVLCGTGGECKRLRDGAVGRYGWRCAAVGRPLGGPAVVGARPHS